jgi:hypothetical protein
MTVIRPVRIEETFWKVEIFKLSYIVASTYSI